MSRMYSKHYSLTQVAPPESEPVTLAELKLFAKVDFTDDDALLSSLITASRTYCETYTGRKFITQTWELGLDCFPNARFGYDVDRADWYATVPIFSVHYFPINPVQAINVIEYQDLSNVTQTLSTSIYELDKRSIMARLLPKYNQFWPISLPVPNAVIVNFDVGYGPDASYVPESIKTAIKMQALNLYDNRNPNSDSVKYPLDTIHALLANYTILDM